MSVKLTDVQKDAVKAENNTAKRISLLVEYLAINTDEALVVLEDLLTEKVEKIDLTEEDDGTINFTNSNGEVNKVGNSKYENYKLYSTNLGSVNMNPVMFNLEEDYRNFIRNSNGKVTMDTKEGFYSIAALKLDEHRDTLESDNKYMLSDYLEYRGNLIVKTEGLNSMPNDGTYKLLHYIGVSCYDHDDNYISSLTQGSKANPDKRYTLKNDYNPGDTTITIVGDINEWLAYSSNSHYRHLQLYPLRDDGTYGYISDSGFYYEPLWYTRYTFINAWSTDDDLVDNGDGSFTITLNTVYNRLFPAGTVISQGYHGGGYNYFYNINVPIDNEWHEVKGNWMSRDDLNDPDNVFRNGTKYVRMILLANYALLKPDNSYVSTAKDTITHFAKISLDWRQK